MTLSGRVTASTIRRGSSRFIWQRNFANQSTIFAATTSFVPDFIPGVTPLPTTAQALTELPAGAGTSGQWYDPDLQDQQSQQTHVGWAHTFPHQTVLTVDYTHVRNTHGWRQIDVNPVLPSTGTRPLAADLGRVFGDSNLLGPVILAASLNRSEYDEVAVHFERRFSSASSLIVNYALARAWAQGG